jgi:aspartate aminotransferase
MNPRLAAIPGSLIRELNALKRPTSLDLGLGEPTLRPDPRPFDIARDWIARHGCPYSPNPGFQDLRAAIATTLAVPGISGPSDVCVTNGSQEALYLAIKSLLDPARDEVAIVSPAYPLYAKLAQLEGLATRFIPLDPATGFAPDADRVLAGLGPQTRLLVLASPANPTGRVWPAQQLERLARGLLERPGQPVLVLSDEVYRDLAGPEGPAPSLATWYGPTYVAGSLSKSHALTGLRLGWLAGPREGIAAATKVHQFLTTAASTFSQRVAHAILTDPSTFPPPRAHYAHQRESLARMLSEAGLAALPPEGAFYTLVRLSGAPGSDPVAPARELLASEDVVTIPGIAFGDEAADWIRLSCVAEERVLQEAVTRIARFVQR